MTKTLKSLIVKLVTKVFLIDVSDLNKLLRIIEKMHKMNGLVYTYLYMKTARLHVTRYICGHPLMHNSNNVSTQNGWPTKFLFLKKYCNRDITSKRYLLTLMNMTKAIWPQNKNEWTKLPVSFNSITDKYTGKVYVIPRFFIDAMNRKYRISPIKLDLNEDSIFLNMKSSPTGPSTMTSWKSMLKLSYSEIQDIYNLVGEKIIKVFDFNYKRAFESKTVGRESLTSGKLSIVHDTEGKERVIAMLDYWSQVALKPIHDHVLTFLKRIKMDRTFTQDPFNNWKDDGELFWSLDLSSATDRFPIFLQEKIVSSIFGNKVSTSWAHLLTNREFEFDSKLYKYSVGQPMGSYSSWAVFTLTHHYAVQYAAYLCGYNLFEDYILLGDDIVIKNNRVAQRYIALMTKWGVDISKNKTHVSKDTYEFAKRWICNESEISPLPLKGISQNYINPKVVYTILMEWSRKTNFWVSDQSIVNVLKDSYKGLRLKNQWITSSLISKHLDEFSIALRYIFNELTNIELTEYLANKLPNIELPDPTLIHAFMHGLLNHGISKAVTKTNARIINLFETFLTEMTSSRLQYMGITNSRGLKNYVYQEVEPYFENKADIRHHVLTYSLTNQLKGMHNFLSTYEDNHNNLLELIKHMVSPGVSEIISLKRETRTMVNGLSSTWKSSIKYYEETEAYMMKDENYILSSYTNWIVVADNSIVNSIALFDKLLQGTYKDPSIVEEKTSTYEDLWSTFAATA